MDLPINVETAYNSLAQIEWGFLSVVLLSCFFMSSPEEAQGFHQKKT